MATCSSTSLIICSINILANQEDRKKEKLEKKHLHPPLASADKAFKYLRTFVSSFPQGGEIQPENKKNNE